MHTRFDRLGVLLAVSALLFAACGGSATPSPAASASAPPSEAVVAPSASPSASAAPSTVPTVPPGGPVKITWFCCLGGGDGQPARHPVFRLAGEQSEGDGDGDGAGGGGDELGGAGGESKDTGHGFTFGGQPGRP